MAVTKAANKKRNVDNLERSGGRPRLDEQRRRAPPPLSVARSSWQSRPLCWRHIIVVPMKLPQPFQLNLLHVPVEKADIDCAGEPVRRRPVARDRQRTAAMARNRQVLHPGII